MIDVIVSFGALEGLTRFKVKANSTDPPFGKADS